MVGKGETQLGCKGPTGRRKNGKPQVGKERIWILVCLLSFSGVTSGKNHFTSLGRMSLFASIRESEGPQRP